VVLRFGAVVATGTHSSLAVSDPDYRAAVLR
jgi:hypothetical protein